MHALEQTSAQRSTAVYCAIAFDDASCAAQAHPQNTGPCHSPCARHPAPAVSASCTAVCAQPAHCAVLVHFAREASQTTRWNDAQLRPFSAMCASCELACGDAVRALWQRRQQRCKNVGFRTCRQARCSHAAFGGRMVINRTGVIQILGCTSVKTYSWVSFCVRMCKPLLAARCGVADAVLICFAPLHRSWGEEEDEEEVCQWSGWS